MDLLSAQVILTADVENTKAVLSTKVASVYRATMVTTDFVPFPQFSQFGKGEDFHHIWHDLMKDSVFASMNSPEISQMRSLY